MNGSDDYSMDADLTAEDQKIENYTARLEKQYQDAYSEKSLQSFEETSGAIIAAKMHQYPMDPSNVQTMKIQAMRDMPDPKRAWLLYYQGAYMRKFGMKTQAQAVVPGTLDMVNKRNESEDLTED